MNELLKKDITMKIISVLFGIIIWFSVLDNINPYRTKSLSVPITVENETMLQNGNIIVKKEYTRYVTVTIKGREAKINNAVPSDFLVKLDFSRVKSLNDSTIKLDGPYYVGKDGLSDSDIKIEMTPKTLKLEMEKVVKTFFKVEVDLSGKPKEGYHIIKESIEPETLSLQGPDSLLKTVGSVKAVADITNLDKNITLQQDCKVYDKMGKEILQLSKNLSAKVNISVAKEVDIRPVVKGKPAPNYTEVSREVNPSKVLITGDPSILAEITELETEPVSIEDIKNTVDLTGKIIVPNGLKLYNPPKNITVNVKVEPLITKQFSITKDMISLNNTEIDNSLNYLIQTEGLKISIKGPRSAINALDAESIAPYADVFGLGEGTYNLQLKVSLPDNCRAVGDSHIDLLVQKRG